MGLVFAPAVRGRKTNVKDPRTIAARMTLGGTVRSLKNSQNYIYFNST
jgi:hypothetical protein